MRFSIIMPLLNEELILEQQLNHIVRQCAGRDCELLLVDGGSTDRTIDIAQRFGKVIHAPRGRASQMNTGAAEATGQVLLFLHADTLLPESAFCAIEHALINQAVVGGAFQICFNCDRWLYRLVALTINLRSRIRKIFTGDQAYFVRTPSFKAIGGFPDQPLMEDLEIITRLRKIGKVVLLPHYVTTSARRHEKMGLARSIFIMWYLRLLYRLGAPPAQLQRMYPDVRCSQTQRSKWG